MILILLGPPGVGKGTQARILSTRIQAEQLSTGDMIRAEVGAGTDLGREARTYMDKGNLVPDELILRMVEGRLGRNPRGGYLLDGFPRTVAQAEGLDRIVAAIGRKVDVVVALTVPDEAVVRRLGSRLTCPVDGRAYNQLTQPPRVPGQCDDHPGTALVLRSDDRPETVRHRLEVYDVQTRPLVDYYRGRGLLTEVDGDGTVDEVTVRIEAALDRGLARS